MQINLNLNQMKDSGHKALTSFVHNPYVTVKQVTQLTALTMSPSTNSQNPRYLIYVISRR